MFRSLAARLTATYVFAAIVLVVLVVGAVMIFTLSMFGISTRMTTDEAARQVPEEVRLEIGRSGTLEAAAADIARHLSRRGLRVAVFEQAGLRRRFLAASVPNPDGGDPVTFVNSDRSFDPGPPGSRPPGPPGLPGSLGPPGRRFERMDPYPFSLNFFLHLAPRNVDFPHGRVTLVPDPGDFVRAVNAFLIAMVWIGSFAVVAAYLLGRYITGQALRPLVETTASLQRFGDGDFTPRPVEATSRDEIGELVRAYNAAALQVSAAFEERRMAEVEMRQFIADAGHELRTPLTVLMGFVDVLRRRAHADPISSTKIFDSMTVESRRMKALIDKLILLARLENPHVRELETVDLSAIAGGVVASLQALAPDARLLLHVENDGLVRGYESELYDAVCNLVENALKYAPESPVAIRVSGDRDTVAVDVSDRGPGICASDQQLVFSRFYRGRDRGDTEGFGLGLSIARRAVERAGGTLTLVSEPGSGSCFTIRVPRATRGENVPVAV